MRRAVRTCGGSCDAGCSPGRLRLDGSLTVSPWLTSSQNARADEARPGCGLRPHPHPCVPGGLSPQRRDLTRLRLSAAYLRGREVNAPVSYTHLRAHETRHD